MAAEGSDHRPPSPPAPKVGQGLAAPLGQKPTPLSAKGSSVRGDLPRVAGAMLEALGGHENYGVVFAEDMKNIRDHEKTPELKEIQRQRLLVSYHRQIQSLVSKKAQYELDTNEFAGYSEQDLQLVLREAALTALREDPSFRASLMGVLAQTDPMEARALLGIDVLEEPGYTEAIE